MTTIGLEMHVELSTATKMFCSCAVAFGREPNSRVCPVCLGLPGTLPVPNQKAVELTTKIALALGCEISPRSIFHRKNYFYPDMPKDYQISQYDIPVGGRGAVEVDFDGVARSIGITRVHLEEDTGKTVHSGEGGRIHAAGYALEDFNRAGTPLVEVVTEPDLTSAAEAKSFAQEIRTILRYLDVSDVRMEEGSLRIDANISVSPPGERGVKTEVKNMNSMRSLERALAHEEERQRRALVAGELLEQSTRHWDEERGVTVEGRAKEYSSDYRYFPEPDLTPLEPSVEWLRQLSEEIPELPAARRARLIKTGLTDYDARVITASRPLADFFDGASAAASSSPKQVANWVANDLLGALGETDEGVEQIPVRAGDFASLVDLVTAGDLSRGQGKQVLEEMISTGKAPRKIVQERGLGQISDTSEIESAVDQVIAAHAEVAGRIRAGEDKPLGFLVGQVMKATGGRASAQVVRRLLEERLE